MGDRPRLAEGIELVGEFQDSGYKVAPYIARRADGQTIQMPQLLYLVAEAADGESTYEEIAARATERFGRELAPDDAQMLVEERLRPLGVLAQADGSSPKLEKVDPLLALKFRVALVSERAVRRVTTLFLPFFFPVTMLAVVGGLVAFDLWLFFVHGIGQSTRALVYNPLLLLMVFACIVAATALHEIGHATATRYGGARPGVMGAGIYVVWPAFYTDVTDAYRLSRWSRVRVDLGGIFFNGLFVLGTAGAYFLTGFEPLLIVILLQHFQVLQQLLPLLRMDGYYVLSDLTGVPDLFMRIKPTLLGMLPWREPDEKVSQLKPWVRIVVTAWVVVLVPFLLFVFGMMIVNVPRIFATAYDSFLVHVDDAGKQWGDGKTLRAGVSGLQTAALVLPALGIVYSFTRASTRSYRGAWSWADGDRLRQGGVLAGFAGIAALLAFVWWPNGDYRPIQPGERGTVLGAVNQLDAIPTGRPGLTPERQQDLGGAPTRHDGGGSNGGSDQPAPGGAGSTTDTTSTDGTSTTTTEDSGSTTTTGTSTTETTTTGTTTTETTTTDTTTTATTTGGTP